MDIGPEHHKLIIISTVVDSYAAGAKVFLIRSVRVIFSATSQHVKKYIKNSTHLTKKLFLSMVF